MKKWLYVLALVAGVTAGCAQAPAGSPEGCDRDCLRGIVTQYLDALVAQNPAAVPVAPSVRFTEDTVELKPGEGLWKTASGLTPYRQDILDVQQGVAASFALVDAGGSPVMLALRLKTAGGRITEIETQVTRNQREGLLFAPDALQRASPAMTVVPQGPQLQSRAEAIRIAELYPAGLKAGSFVTVDAPFAADAYRFENGRLMAGLECTFAPGCNDIRTQRIPTLSEVTHRVLAVDEELGIVLLRLDFGANSTRQEGESLIVWEAFKIYGGEIHAVEAFMKVMPRGAPSGWD